MRKNRKAEQLQIRVSRSQKLAIKRRAERAGLGMSEWVLRTLLPSPPVTFRGLVEELAASKQPSHAFAELLDWLDAMSADEFAAAVSEPPEAELDPYWRNYLAATLEQAAAAKQVAAPSWTLDVPPLDRPAFGSSLQSLRLHLLVNSPPAFAGRNIFIDSSVGKRV